MRGTTKDRVGRMSPLPSGPRAGSIMPASDLRSVRIWAARARQNPPMQAKYASISRQPRIRPTLAWCTSKPTQTKW